MRSLTRENLYSISFTTFSNVGLKISSGALITIYSFFFNPLKTELYYGIAALIIFDFVTAIIAAFKRKELITSARASRTIVKLFLYGLMISGATIVDKFFLGIGEVFGDLTMVFVAVTEFISILENIKKYGFEVPTGVISRLNLLKKQEVLAKVDQAKEELHKKVEQEAEKIKESI
jgi:phage-related holin